MIDYAPVHADEVLRHDLTALVRLSIAEDLRDSMDWTTVCIMPPDARGGCEIRTRADGVAAGLVTLPWIIDEFDADLHAETLIEDGQRFTKGQTLARLTGNVRDLLTAERTVLNLISRMCGIATMTAAYVAALGDSKAKLYDTRKTTPGWRLLEKYAVRCGGGHNHRSGLYDGFLIKDNHLWLAGKNGQPLSAAQAATRAIHWRDGKVGHHNAPPIVEIEVDSLEQFREVLPVNPDIILLDNYSLDHLRIAVQERNAAGSSVQLEASGNVRIETIGTIAATGVDRISSGALTHQATSLDLGLDWFDYR
jgi:nicotinate-nucleotide pyrophosphorylase (carboxylating)